MRLLVIILLLFLASPCSGQKVDGLPEIDNFGQVDKCLYRGAQPGKKDFPALAKFGVKTVINLRRDPEKDEQQAVAVVGMRYVHLPMDSNHLPTDEQIVQFLSIINDPSSTPVFIHCEQGRHRTGVMIAIYRLIHYKWSLEQAMAEMLKYKFNHGGSSKKWRAFLENYYNHNASFSTLAHFQKYA
jgi:uncharacterized protein (TIGR01244 family)